VEVAEIRPQNNVRIGENGSSTQLLKPGLYSFEANRNIIRVFDGKAVVEIAGRRIEVKDGHQLDLNTAGKLNSQKFDKSASTDEFYRWASLRSSYLAEANVDAARRYAGATGWSPSIWAGDGWYWSPWFDAYTFIPGDGIFFDPFGWGFYSPWFAFGAPYFGYGYGGFRHFGPGYHAPYRSGVPSTAFVGHAHSVAGGSVGGFSRAGGFGGRAVGGFHGGGAGGFHGGGGGRGR
jgi:hypothetical protein